MNDNTISWFNKAIVTNYATWFYSLWNTLDTIYREWYFLWGVSENIDIKNNNFLYFNEECFHNWTSNCYNSYSWHIKLANTSTYFLEYNVWIGYSENNGEYTVTPETITSVLQQVESGDTIKLIAWHYWDVTIYWKEFSDEKLTIRPFSDWSVVTFETLSINESENIDISWISILHSERKNTRDRAGLLINNSDYISVTDSEIIWWQENIWNDDLWWAQIYYSNNISLTNTLIKDYYKHLVLQDVNTITVENNEFNWIGKAWMNIWENSADVTVTWNSFKNLNSWELTFFVDSFTYNQIVQSWEDPRTNQSFIRERALYTYNVFEVDTKEEAETVIEKMWVWDVMMTTLWALWIVNQTHASYDSEVVFYNQAWAQYVLYWDSLLHVWTWLLDWIDLLESFWQRVISIIWIFVFEFIETDNAWDVHPQYKLEDSSDELNFFEEAALFLAWLRRWKVDTDIFTDADKLKKWAKVLVKKTDLQKIAWQVDDILLENIWEIKKLYPNAKIWYRGSLATGKKTLKDSNGNAILDADWNIQFVDFNPNDFDVDAFIIDDDLAGKISGYWKDVKDWDDELKGLVDDIQKQLKEINWYRIEDKTFTFRVWTQLKFDEKVKDFGYKIIQ